MTNKRNSAPKAELPLSASVMNRALFKTAILVAFLFPIIWIWLGWMAGIDFMFFSSWNICNLFFLSKTLILMGIKKRFVLGALYGGGVFLLIAILLLYFNYVRPTLFSFLVGFHLPYAVLVLQALGRNREYPMDLREARAPEGICSQAEDDERKHSA